MPKEQARFIHADKMLKFPEGRGNPNTVYKILDALYEDRVTAPITVYRALEKLHKDGKVHRIESSNAWAACCEPHHSDPNLWILRLLWQRYRTCGNVLFQRNRGSVIKNRIHA